MHSLGGDSPGRKAGKKYSKYQRPAEGKGMRKGKVPKGVSGRSLGAGAKRAKAGSSGKGSKAMVLIAVSIFTPPILATLAAIGYVVRGHL
jgi:hypothetical protein